MSAAREYGEHANLPCDDGNSDTQWPYVDEGRAEQEDSPSADLAGKVEDTFAVAAAVLYTGRDDLAVGWSWWEALEARQ